MEAYIRAISTYFPEKVLTNDDLVAQFPEWSVNKITDKIGVEQRHIAANDETASDMAVKAVLKLKDEFNLNDIDFLIFCTQSPDYFLPTSACLIQEKLNLPTSIGAIDINQGCSGYVYGLSLAKALISSGTSQNVLLITAETYSKYIHDTDKSNLSIFGDAATATIISTTGNFKIKDFVFGTDGSGKDDLIVRNGASRNKSSNILSDEINTDDFLYMNGGNVFNFTLKFVPNLINTTLEKNKIKKEDIDQFVLHQANSFMLNTLRKICEIDSEKFYNNIKLTGNTVSSTIPIALSNLYFSSIKSSDRNIVLAGFGVGYSWAGCALEKSL